MDTKTLIDKYNIENFTNYINFIIRNHQAGKGNLRFLVNLLKTTGGSNLKELDINPVEIENFNIDIYLDFLEFCLDSKFIF
uniref:Protein P9 n=1 Tax=Lettuce infectious yellows virus (isolate United States/92) TaxID=651355 RepID=P9_LIYV9|nr:RecName: Full=Protein P9 [Lettuce infectious yellows virus isolate 92]